ncbi:uncharacterized protein LOC127759955 [Oryza glaberrima]|uniref:uncharacterized protein LOC127759955 n=1 Tax=Oryza glaberrima TaxID=4538 RepID=UPI00224C3F85|nr:uncharacterized protein LOC127759955 [Oryza glaberrima]
MAGYTEILDTNHHEHKVCLVRKDEPFICSGCKELGFELRYACHTARCNHQYHRSCILQPLNTRVPAPFYKHDFFFFKSVSTAGARCEACAAEVRGYVYYCPDKKVSLHPCCADLPRVITTETVQLKLERKITKKCGMCHERNQGSFSNPWAYASSEKMIQLHVACVRKALVSQFESRLYGVQKPKMLLPPPPAAGASAASSTSSSTAIVECNSFPVLEVDKYRRKSAGFLDTFRRIVRAVMAMVSAVITGNHLEIYMAFIEFFKPN